MQENETEGRKEDVWWMKTFVLSDILIKKYNEKLIMWVADLILICS